MPVDQTQISPEEQREAIEAEVEKSGRGAKPFVTGEALATDDAEMARNRRLMQPQTEDSVDPRKMFRAPKQRLQQGAAVEGQEEVIPDGTGPSAPKDERVLHTGDMESIYVPPHERQVPAAAPRNQPSPQMREAAEVAPETTAKNAAPATKPEDEEGLRLEREILGGMGSDVVASDDTIPDSMVDIGGKQYPLSRIRAGEDALRNKMKWEAELTQKSQAMTTAWNQVMQETANGMRGDIVGSARKLGMSDHEIRTQLARAGFGPLESAAGNAPTPVTALPDDADPLAKALHAENRRKDQEIAELRRRMDGFEQSNQQERARRSQETTEAARLAVLSGIKHELTATALKMPSMREADGQLSPTAKVLVDSTSLRIENELRATPRVPEHAIVRNRAMQLFGETARSSGIISKAEQARRAIERPKAAVPARAGTTVQGVHPGAPTTRPAPTKMQPFDWTDDDQRHRAMRAAMDNIAAELES